MAWFTLGGEKKSKSTPTKKLSRGSPTIEALLFFKMYQTFKKKLDKIERKWPGLILRLITLFIGRL